MRVISHTANCPSSESGEVLFVFCLFLGHAEKLEQTPLVSLAGESEKEGLKLNHIQQAQALESLECSLCNVADAVVAESQHLQPSQVC